MRVLRHVLSLDRHPHGRDRHLLDDVVERQRRADRVRPRHRRAEVDGAGQSLTFASGVPDVVAGHEAEQHLRLQGHRPVQRWHQLRELELDADDGRGSERADAAQADRHERSRPRSGIHHHQQHGVPYYVFILDPDGAVVWWTAFQGTPTRAHMSWDGRDMYIVSLSAGGGAQTTAGNVARISMDGTNSETHLSGLGGAHHDVTAIPNGVAAIMWNTSDMDAHNSVVERAADGTITTVVADLADIYNSTTFHPNSIHYAPWDDTYTIGDRNPNLFVKITRKGQLVWQLGGSNPKDPSKFFLLQGVPTWLINHGHHLLADGTFVFFNNGGRAVHVLKLDEATMTATSVLTYSGVSGQILGDAQRLPNGNILATDSDAKHIDELDASGHVLATFVASQYLGYAEFRESLYGPPPY